MSRFLEIQPKAALTIGISTALAAGIAYGTVKLFRRIQCDRPPTKWRKVGEISQIYCFPVKSCGPIVLDEIECGKLGSHYGEIRDRVFLVVRPSGEFVTARTYPKMVVIMPKIVGDVMTVTAPGMEEIKISIRQLYTSDNVIKVKVHKDEANCIDCGDEAAQWFSKYVLEESEGLRLVFYPSSDPKPVVINRTIDRKDTGALHDETSFMLMNQASFDDLNTRIESPVTPLQYRPNFVVTGPYAWAEDNWNWVKIGNETVFRNIQPCIRCILTNIDPVTGERHPDMEPLRTLKKFRTFEEIAPNPWFGIHLGIRSVGKVKRGDEVFVG